MPSVHSFRVDVFLWNAQGSLTVGVDLAGAHMKIHGNALLPLLRQRQGPLPSCLSGTCKLIQSAFSDPRNFFCGGERKQVHLFLVVCMLCRPDLCG